jgi:EAL domain-containing protein (putative c-di-GMP-specific phosphodiesterase class I)
VRACLGRYVRRKFDIHQVPPGMICFEITETSAIADLSSAKRFIQALKKLGCRFSLDDFGTGMSSVLLEAFPC